MAGALTRYVCVVVVLVQADDLESASDARFLHELSADAGTRT